MGPINTQGAANAQQGAGQQTAQTQQTDAQQRVMTQLFSNFLNKFISAANENANNG